METSADKIHLKLFRHTYTFPDSKNLKRILLEGEHIYLYLWLNPEMQLENFQIIWNDRYVMDFSQAGGLQYGELSREPFNRSITGKVSPEIISELKDQARHFESDLFPGLIGMVKAIAAEERGISFGADPQEQRLISGLRES